MEFKIVGGQFRVPADLPEVPDHPVEGKERFYNGFIIRALKAILRAQGVKVTCFGAENLPLEGGALLAMNHTNYYDFILGEIPGHVRGRRLVRFMAKKEVFDAPVVGTFMRAMDHISVDRKRGGTSIDEAVNRIQSGQIVGIFPEATISRSFELKDFKTGAVRIAAAADAPLVPMVTWGGQRIWTKGLDKNLGRSHVPVFIRVGAPVDSSGTPEEATARLKAAMQELLTQVRTDYETEYGPFPEGLAWRPASLGGAAPSLADADRIEAAYRAERDAKREAKTAKRGKSTARRIDRKADRALGNGPGLLSRLKSLLRR